MPRHYVVGEWTDFVRNLISEKERSEMELHRANCTECQALSDFLQKVAGAALSEGSYDSVTSTLAASARNVFVQQPRAGDAEDVADCAVDFQTLAAHLTYAGPIHLRK